MKTAFGSYFWICVMSVLLAGGPTFGYGTSEEDKQKEVTEKVKYSSVCRYVSEMVWQGSRIGATAEKRLGTYNDLKPLVRKYRFTRNALSALRDLKGYIATLSAIDIDNDSVPELRLFITAGSAHCQETSFFKKGRTGKYEYIEPKGLDQTGGRLCSGGVLSFFRYRNGNYLFVHSSPQLLPQRMALYSGRLDGFHYECTIQRSSDQLHASTRCGNPICEIVKRKAQQIVTDAGKGNVFSGAERPVNNPASLPVDWNSLKPFERDEQFLAIDLDNDGIDELVIKGKASPANRLYYKILKQKEGIYRPIDPNNVYHNYRLLGTTDDYLFNDNVIFETSSGRNYFVAIHFEEGSPESCRLDIFLIEKGRVSKMGTVDTIFKKQKDNLTYEPD